MTLRIDMASSQNADVLADIMLIAGTDAPKFSFDSATGEIICHAHPEQLPGGFLLCNLFDDTGIRVTIFGASGRSMQVVGNPGTTHPPGSAIQPLCATGVYWTQPSHRTGGQQPITVDIDLVYDPAGVGGPYFGYDPSDDEIPANSAALLAFLLAAAAHWYTSSYFTGPDPGAIVVDQDACLEVENAFRLANFMPERARPLAIYGKACPVKPHKLVTPPPKKVDNTHYYRVPGCFVATAAYGSPLDEKVDLLRHFRDDVLARTRGGSDFCNRFFARYYKISPAISAQMLMDPELSQLMRQAVVEPLVQWLRLALEAPDASLDGVPAPWRGFLENLQETMEQWASELAQPWGSEGLEGIEGARELAVILRFVIRRPETRCRYLADLESRGVIPLPLAAGEIDAARRLFVESGRAESEIRRLLGSSDNSSSSRFPEGHA